MENFTKFISLETCEFIMKYIKFVEHYSANFTNISLKIHKENVDSLNKNNAWSLENNENMSSMYIVLEVAQNFLVKQIEN